MKVERKKEKENKDEEKEEKKLKMPALFSYFQSYVFRIITETRDKRRTFF